MKFLRSHQKKRYIDIPFQYHGTGIFTFYSTTLPYKATIHVGECTFRPMDGMGLETKKNTSFQLPHHHVWNWDDGLGDPIFTGYIRFRKDRNCINLSSPIYAKGVDFCS